MLICQLAEAREIMLGELDDGTQLFVEQNLDRLCRA